MAKPGTYTESAEPVEDLTRLADSALNTLKADPGWREGDRAIVIVLSPDDNSTGMGITGYPPDNALLAQDLIYVAKAVSSRG